MANNSCIPFFQKDLVRMGKEPFDGPDGIIPSPLKKHLFNEHDGKWFLNNCLKFNMLSRNLCYWKWVFPQDTPPCSNLFLMCFFIHTNKYFQRSLLLRHCGIREWEKHLNSQISLTKNEEAKTHHPARICIWLGRTCVETRHATQRIPFPKRKSHDSSCL